MADLEKHDYPNPKSCPFCDSSAITITTKSWSPDDHGMSWEHTTTFNCKNCRCNIVFDVPEAQALIKFNQRKPADSFVKDCGPSTSIVHHNDYVKKLAKDIAAGLQLAKANYNI